MSFPAFFLFLFLASCHFLDVILLEFEKEEVSYHYNTVWWSGGKLGLQLVQYLSVFADLANNAWDPVPSSVSFRPESIPPSLSVWFSYSKTTVSATVPYYSRGVAR
jgi:hypothetical protein